MADDDSSKILDSIKKALGLQPDYDPFDDELLMHINSVVSTLNQLGVGPGIRSDTSLLKVVAETPWSALLADDKLELIKSYMFKKVKMVFDAGTMPPALISAYEKMIADDEWRITVGSDPMIPQLQPGVEEEPILLDAGEI